LSVPSSAGGAVTKIHTTTLITPEEAVRAMQAPGRLPTRRRVKLKCDLAGAGRPRTAVGQVKPAVAVLSLLGGTDMALRRWVDCTEGISLISNLHLAPPRVPDRRRVVARGLRWGRAAGRPSAEPSPPWR
jgi:hypothetical protein